MLTGLDAILFPDDCEVVEIPLHDRYVYLIQKNGSSSLRLDSLEQKLRIFKNQDIRELHAIDVYLRDPVERDLSGVNTFVQHLIRDNPGMDRHTCQMMATRYRFLNRHYLPQWHWLVNLARFINHSCAIRFHAIQQIDQITQRHSRAGAGIYPLDPDTGTLWSVTDLARDTAPLSRTSCATLADRSRSNGSGAACIVLGSIISCVSMPMEP